MIKISFVICYYSGASTIEKALNSLSKEISGNTEVEVIVIENGRLVDNYLRDNYNHLNLSFITIQKNIGLGNARNIGYEKAKGEIVYYLDDDAYLANGFVNKLFKDKFIDKMVCGGGLVKNATSFSFISKLYHQLYFEPIQLGLKLIIGTNMYFKRKLLEDIGGFSLNLNRADESYVLNKIEEKGFASTFHEELEIYHAQPTSLDHVLKVFFYTGYYRNKIFINDRAFIFSVRTFLHFLIVISIILAFYSPIFLFLILLRFLYGKFFQVALNLNLLLILPAFIFNFIRFISEDLGFIYSFFNDKK